MSNKNIDIKINSQSTEAKEEHNNKTEEHNKENKRKKYYERKQAGICVGCGKSPAATNRVYCETCLNKKRKYMSEYDKTPKRIEYKKAYNKEYSKLDKTKEYNKEYSKELYDWCKQHGICTKCHKEKAQKGFTQCLLCRGGHQEYSYNYIRNLSPDKNESRLQRNRENRRKLYYERKQAGICVNCGKRHSYLNRVYCKTCAVRINNKRRDKAHANGVRAKELFYDGHHCQLCGIEMEFKFNEPKYCPTCLEKLRKTIKYASSFIDREKARQEHNNFIWYKHRNKYKNCKDTEENNKEENQNQ